MTDLASTITAVLFDQDADRDPVGVSRLRRIIQADHTATMNDIDDAVRALAAARAVTLVRSTTPSPFRDLSYRGDYYNRVRLNL